MAMGSVWFIMVVSADGSTCIIIAFGGVLFRDPTRLGTVVTSSGGRDVVVVVVIPLPKRRGGARFLEASHGSTIIP